MIRVGAAVVLSLVTFLVFPSSSRAVENTWDYSVQVSSAVEASPARITLSWPQDSSGVPASYTVFRKSPAAVSWGAGTKLAGDATRYVDTAVTPGQPYEYRIVKARSTYTGYGYIQTGIELPLVEQRGTVALIVDRTYASTLAAELDRLQQDLVGDGWTVLRHEVKRTDSVVSVKQLIVEDCEADSRMTAVFLFGHVPVPYSGKLNPDTHPDHVGAWPADVYYGNLHGRWTDTTVNYHQVLNTDPADAARLSNVPGDGKFDQSIIPGAVELEVGRVDFANLPGRESATGQGTFQSEPELLRQYLNKDHLFRHGQMNVQRRAIVGDYFGLRGGEAFSASGYRNFAPLVGADRVTNLNTTFADAKGRWIPALSAQSYLLAYGCGPGTYQTIDGIGGRGDYHDGAAVDIVHNDIQAVFTLIFGSWLGDWDHEDDFMRSILAAPTCTLATAWSGRPHWFVHALGAGETIGYTARLTQNNTGLYQNQINNSANAIHIALLGDPTLRLHPVAPVSAVTGWFTGSGAELAWAPSPDRVIGYHVYRATPQHPDFTRITTALVTNERYLDQENIPGAVYMVRAVKLESTPSGSYFNASQGIFWTAGDIFAQADRSSDNAPAVVASASRVRPADASVRTANSDSGSRAERTLASPR